MKLYKFEDTQSHEKYEYKEEQKDDVIEITLKIRLDTKWKSVQNYIDKCKNKQCLASKTIKNINKRIKEIYERE